MKITYNGHNSFYDGIKSLLERGIGFKADYDSLTITLTGSY